MCVVFRFAFIVQFNNEYANDYCKYQKWGWREMADDTAGNWFNIFSIHIFCGVFLTIKK